MLVLPTPSVPADRQVGVSLPSARGTLTGAVDSVPAGASERAPSAVLLVEDDVKFAQLLIRVFDRAGIATLHTSSGDQALRIIHSGAPLQAAVLDVMIPHPDGLEVCRHLRRLSPRVPVVAISARTGAQHRTRALAAGAEVFLEKPFALRDLVSVTAALVARSPQGTP